MTSVALSGLLAKSRIVFATLALTAVYYLAGIFGLSLAMLHPSASAVWPPSGIAFAALLIWGYKLWPGVFLGAFLVNLAAASSPVASWMIAGGNTLEAFLGAWLIRKFADGPKVFERARNIFKFVLLAALMSTAVSATIGVTTLALAGAAPWSQVGSIWLTWWLGDIAGDLLIAPLVVIWFTQAYPRLVLPRVVEAAALLLAVTLVSYFLFVGQRGPGVEFLIFLPLLWAAFRFGQRGAVTAAFLIFSVALAGTLQGMGPFAIGDSHEALLYLQGFTATIAMATLILAAVVTEQTRVEEQLQVQEGLGRILADSPDLSKAGSEILQVLCERANWSSGAIWEVDQTSNELKCVEFWHVPGETAPYFEAATRERRFSAGIGLPGRVWSSGRAAWIRDVQKDTNFPRAEMAAREGLRAAFAFPIKLASEIVGVVECFSREVRELDDDFLRITDDIGDQLGRFIERKRSEEALQRSEKELADFFDTSPLSLHWVGPDGIILKANDAELKMLGYSREEYVGRHIADFHVDENVIGDILARSKRGETIKEFPAQMRCKDGSIRDVLINSSVYWEDGRFVHTRCFILDITALKAAEQARSMLAAIVESSDDAVISKTLEGMITSWNAGAERLLGYRSDELIGQPIFRIIPPESHEEEAMILSRLRAGERIDHFETVRVAKDGRPIPVSLTVSPIRDSDGATVGASSIARDITFRKQYEAQLAKAQEDLMRANEQLERRVRERTAELEDANAALLRTMEEQQQLEAQLRQAQKMESIGTLAGGIAHDFNNTLNIIKAYATLIGGRYSGNRQILESVKIIEEEVERGAAVVRQLLMLARKNETKPRPTDVNEVLISVRKLIAEIFPRNIEVALDLQEELPMVLVDPNLLSQALLNICVNARDAMPDGGQLRVKTTCLEPGAAKAIHRDAAETRYVSIAISDTGYGMKEDIKSRIFEPFFTTKGVGEGTGLGLSMVYGIVRAHTGYVDVESAVGRGSTFRILLPVTRETAPIELRETNASVSEVAPYRATVLVVEDEEAMLQLLQNALARAGYRSLSAVDGSQALELYSERKDEVDLVLVDLGLPKTSGPQVIRAMKSQNRSVKIVVTTGYLEPELKAELFDLGIQDYIEKPYSLDAVITKVAAVLDHRAET